MPQKKKKVKYLNKLLKVIVYLVILIIVFTIAPNYEKIAEYYIENKINLIIDNKNETKNLKYDLFINEKNVIYMAIKDVKEYFDNSVTFDKENNQIITTYGEKKLKLPVDKKYIEINNRKQSVLSGALKKDEIFYIPITATAIEKFYERDINYIESKQILLIDSLTKKLVKADISKKCSVKYKTTAYSQTVDKLKKADKVVVIENLENNWSKIRTKNGIIGYVKTNVLQNEIYVREDFDF